MTKQIKIVVYIGVMGSGKDYQAHKLITNQNYVKVAFADEVRKDLWKLIGWEPKTEQAYEDFKNHKFVNLDGSTYTGRDLLQRYGTNIRREEDENVWARKTVQTLKKHIKSGLTKFVITDCRFENEVEYLKQFNIQNKNIDVEFRNCNYKSDRYDISSKHESEKFSQTFRNWEGHDKYFDVLMYSNKWYELSEDEFKYLKL